jgi:hypothetical protein
MASYAFQAAPAAVAPKYKSTEWDASGAANIMHDARVRRGNTHGAKPSLGATSASGTALKTIQGSTRRRKVFDPFRTKLKDVDRE